VVRDRERDVAEPTDERREVRGEVDMGVGMDNVEPIGVSLEVARYGGRDLIPKYGRPRVQSDNPIPLTVFGPWLGVVVSGCYDSNLVTTFYLITTHCMDMVTPTAFLIRIEVLRDPEDLHLLSNFVEDG